MTVRQTNIVDFIGVDRVSGDVILTIADDLAWTGSVGDHLLMVQEKINTYLRFIESGEILTEYPDAKGRRVVIKVVGLHEPNQEAKAFYQRAADTIAAAGFSLLFERYKESD